MTDYSRFASLLIERREDGILWITLNRPEKMNAITREGYHELATIWPVIGEDRDTRAIVITGAGRAFSAGGSLSWAREFTSGVNPMAAFSRDCVKMLRQMADLDKPIIAAINGPAAGAGLALAMMSDITLMAEDAYLFSGQLNMGVAAGDHSVLLWPLAASMAKVKLHLLTGEPMDGRRAARMGLVSRAVPGETLLAEAHALARQLADGPQSAQAWTKRALGNWTRRSIMHLDYSLALETLGFQSPDGREGVAALNAKRPPDFPSAR